MHGAQGAQLKRLWAIAGRPRLTKAPADDEESGHQQPGSVQALDRGADDHLGKPFSPRTLLARVRALLRRGRDEADRPEPLLVGSLRLDVERRVVSVGDRTPARLTPLELRLLQFLVARRGETVPSERLLVHVWGGRGEGDRQLLKQLVHRLRQKIEPDPAAPRHILTSAGEGYRLEA